jgi:predicted outer membrane repeat protein
MVSAAENVSTDADVNNGNEYLANQVTDVDIVSESSDVGTFTELNDEIKNAKIHSQTTVNLTKDYKYQASDYNLRNGIEIDGITINGNGHTIDGRNLARIFSQSSGSVTLNNVKFVNGYASSKSNGGAYLLSEGTLTVNNCQFENNTAGQHGGAIGVSSNQGENFLNVYNSSFKNNSAKFNGGSIYSNNLEVDNSYFELNKILTRSSTEYTTIGQKGLGGAICSVDSKIKNSKFNNNSVLNSGYWQIEEGGGAITSLKTMTVDNCIH